MAAVRIDECARTLSALLAATDWPEREQQTGPFGIHPQAVALRRHAESFRDHPGVAFLQHALNSISDDSAPYFEVVLNMSWPDFEPDSESASKSLPGLDAAEFGLHLKSFLTDAGLATFWKEYDQDWADAVSAIREHLLGLDIMLFLGSFFGDDGLEIVCVPNVLFPTQHAIGVVTATEISCLIPPRRAVGQSPPWPFADDREHVIRSVIFAACGALLPDYFTKHADEVSGAAESAAALEFDEGFLKRYPDWQLQFARLLTLAAIALFLDEVDPGAGQSYVLMEQRAGRGLRRLPTFVTVLQGYLVKQRAGEYRHVAEYMPRLVFDLKAATDK